MSEAKKLHLIKCGICVGIIIAAFGILSGFICLARKNWINGLKVAAERTLPEKSGYKVMDFVPIESNLSTSAGCFALGGEASTDGDLIFVVRATTYYGPFPAVYVYHASNGAAEFIGFYMLNSTISKQIVLDGNDSCIKFWKSRCEILAKEYTASKKELKK